MTEGTYSWWEKLLNLDKVDSLKEKLDECTEAREILTRNYLGLNEKYLEIVGTMTSETLELYQQIQDLQNLIAKSIPIPDISEHISDPVVLKPFDENIGLTLGMIADVAYNTWTVDQWTNILTEVQDNVETHALDQGWVKNISDCDDFALVLNGHAVTTFLHAGLDKQGALLFARSRGHAYNLFVAHSGDDFIPYVYEPQNNKIVGKLDEVDAEPYVTIKGWYLGADVTLADG